MFLFRHKKPCNERISKMENDRLPELRKDIARLRESMHQLFLKNKKVTREVLLVSNLLDQRINSYIKLNDRGDNY